MFPGFTAKERQVRLLIHFTREDGMTIMKKLNSTRVFLVLIAILGVAIIAGCPLLPGGSVPVDVKAPTVGLVGPANVATNVAVNTKVVAAFSEPMKPSTISATTFTLKKGATAVAGTVTYTGTSATFTPTATLDASTTYTATITTGATDRADNALAANKVWTFTTGLLPDTTRPTVGTVLPLPSATGVAVNIHVSATFSELMDPLTVTTATFILRQGTTAIAGAVARVGNTATFTPTALLAYSTVYTATVSTGAKDLAGNALLAPYNWSFTTGVAPDITKPTVSSTVPISGAVGADRNANLTAVFSEAMAPLTITSTTFTLKKGTTVVAGSVAYAGTTATFNPTATLDGGTLYTATITTGAHDLAGNALAVDKVWTFTTVAAATGPAPVLLGTAINYVILAKSAISTVPPSVITGDIGLSPAAQTFITGFSLTTWTGYATSAQVSGKVYAADQTPPTPANMTTAISDMELAYTDAAGRPTPDFNPPPYTDLATQTLVAGLYKWTGNVTATGNFTISGGANDVWIFQISGTLDIGNTVEVTLSGGAQAKNIFWQVAGAVTLGTTSKFKGIILGMTGISLQTGAELVGKALAQTAVTLDSATVKTGP